MADSKKRWTVTYTRHIKQKRKVYQDGFLQLHISTKKVMLFDEFEKLLECRIMKEDEVLSPGETLTFNSYLVDVGEPEGDTGDHEPLSDFNLQRKDRKIAERPNLINRRKFKSPSVSSGDIKENQEKNKEMLNKPSPSMKIIREFKKSKLQRYGTQKSSPDVLKSSITEWVVLYTTQVTQKAKKYHDGFLKLTTCGSFGRQVSLYDTCRKLLTSRFLKAEEIISSGESISLEGHLVEVGEPEGDRKPLVDLTSRKDNCNVVGETKTRHEQENSHHSTISDRKEWHVMYTTQVTQKAKKYHDGFLSLQTCGSLARQIKLYDSNRDLLDSRYLRKDEIIRSGDSIAFGAHLVDIGEPEENNQLKADLNIKENKFSVSGKAGKTLTDGYVRSFEDKKSVAKGKAQHDAGASNTSSITRTNLSKNFPTNKPLRDARQILSILQKPPGRESVAVVCADKSITAPVSSAKGLQVMDADMDYSQNSQIPNASPSNDGHRENVDSERSNIIMHTGKSSDLDSSKVVSESRASLPSNDAEAEDQPLLENVEADERKIVEQPQSAREMNEGPSFDLGF